MLNTLLIISLVLYVIVASIITALFIQEGYTQNYRSWKPLKEEREIIAFWPLILIVLLFEQIV